MTQDRRFAALMIFDAICAAEKSLGYAEPVALTRTTGCGDTTVRYSLQRMLAAGIVTVRRVHERGRTWTRFNVAQGKTKDDVTALYTHKTGRAVTFAADQKRVGYAGRQDRQENAVRDEGDQMDWPALLACEKPGRYLDHPQANSDRFPICGVVSARTPEIAGRFCNGPWA